ncbi:OmpA family protein [Nocardiopsis listeri]|uniref:OmpA family protein n=1 Tax=Nocardiopsis listeri TaxID=53440 RepID=UPI000B03E157|nr:OmpA family protein [Nocardiopsis listeri]
MHPLSRLCAVAFALAFLIGLPYVLLWHVDWPDLPTSWDVALAHLRGWRTPPGVLTAALITALWALWGLFALAIVAESVARLRGVALRLRPLGPLQAIAATAVAATALTPAVAFADTVAPAEQSENEDEDEAPEAAQDDVEQAPVERTRTVSGFELGSAELTEQMRQDLAPTVEMLGDHWDPDVPVRIIGHTDPSGDAERNQELSEERARALAEHLTESLGEDAPDTEITGKGSDQEIEGPAQTQRRVEIAYTLAPAPVPSPQGENQAETEAEAEQPVVTLDNASAATEEDGPRVVVLEVPDGGIAATVAFAGLAGGYLLGKRGSFVPRMALSLPRPRLRAGHPRRLALPAPPERPEPTDEIHERVTLELDHVPGLGLIGKGADAAVRRLIANALDPAEPLAVRVLIIEREVVRLFGATGRDLLRDRPCEPVTMVPTMEDALAFLASELHAMDARERAPLALIASPDPRHEHALSGLLLHGQHRGVTAVILGSWPLGGNCVVDADGLISQTSQPLSTLFHCSWAGSTAEEVREAVLTYHEADHALSERTERPSSRRDTEVWEAERGRPVLVAEDWADDDAFTPVGDSAVWDRLTRAWNEEAEFLDDEGFDEAVTTGAAEGVITTEGTGREAGNRDWSVPDDGAVIAAAFAVFHDTVGGAGPAAADDYDDSGWEETPSAIPAPGTDMDEVTDVAPRKVAPQEMAPAPETREIKETRKDEKVRHQRVPGRKAGRVRVVRMDGPSSSDTPGEHSASIPERLRTTQRPLKESGPIPQEPQQSRVAVTAQALVGPGMAGHKSSTSDSPQPVKPRRPRKAGPRMPRMPRTEG